MPSVSSAPRPDSRCCAGGLRGKWGRGVVRVRSDSAPLKSCFHPSRRITRAGRSRSWTSRNPEIPLRRRSGDGRNHGWRGYSETAEEGEAHSPCRQVRKKGKLSGVPPSAPSVAPFAESRSKRAEDSPNFEICTIPLKLSRNRPHRPVDTIPGFCSHARRETHAVPPDAYCLRIIHVCLQHPGESAFAVCAEKGRWLLDADLAHRHMARAWRGIGRDHRAPWKCACDQHAGAATATTA